MVNDAKTLIIGSIEPYSGKTGIILGLARQLQRRGRQVAYGKPLGTSSKGVIEEDIQFTTQALTLADNQVATPLVSLEREALEKQLEVQQHPDVSTELPKYCQQFAGMEFSNISNNKSFCVIRKC